MKSVKYIRVKISILNKEMNKYLLSAFYGQGPGKYTEAKHGWALSLHMPYNVIKHMIKINNNLRQKNQEIIYRINATRVHSGKRLWLEQSGKESSAQDGGRCGGRGGARMVEIIPPRQDIS